MATVGKAASRPAVATAVGALAIFFVAGCGSTAAQAQTEVSVVTSQLSTSPLSNSDSSPAASSSAASTPSFSPAPVDAATMTISSPLPEPTSVAVVSTANSAAIPNLSSAAVPADCNMPAQNLLGGKTLAKYLPDSGALDYTTAKPIAVQLDGTGTEYLAQYTCSGGGNGAPWPSVIVLYNGDGALVSSLLLSRYTQAEHAGVTGWTASGHSARVTWQSFEGAGGPPTNHQSTLTLSNGTLALT